MQQEVAVMDTHVDELLTPAGVARLAGVTAAAVRNWESTGKLQVALRTVGGVRLFERSAVDRFLAARGQRCAG
jgi:DNA-binding transcriptional MerR regulator